MQSYVAGFVPSGTTNQSFSSALVDLKRGKLVARTGWNGKDMYVHYMSDPIEVDYDEDDNEIELSTVIAPFFILVSPKGANTWVPSVSDILAEDWYIVEKSNKMW